MQERAQGLILRMYPLTESSLIVHWLTEEHGRIATVARGARKPRSSFSGKLDLYYKADFAFVRSRRSQLHTLTEITLQETHSFLRKDLGALTQLVYCAALLEQNTETETPVPEAAQLMRDLLATLQTSPATALTLMLFELIWLEALGQVPDFSETQLRSETHGLAEQLLAGGWRSVASLDAPFHLVRELAQFLHGFIIYHLGRIPPNRQRAMNWPAPLRPN